MLHMYVICGEWNSNEEGWSFAIDDQKGARLLALELTTSFEELRTMVAEDYGIDQSHVMIECSFLPEDLISKLGSPPVIISNDRQVRNFVAYVQNNASIQLCVTFKPRVENMFENLTDFGAAFVAKETDSIVHHDADGDELAFEDTEKESEKAVQLALDNVVKKGERFDMKRILKARMEMCAVRHNFDYKVFKSDKTWWSIRCSDNLCNWSLRAVSVPGSEVFKITKYVSQHTCAPSSKTKGGKTPSAKTIAQLIMPKYHGVKLGPSPSDVVQCMLLEEGVNISYSLAFDAREYAVNAVRGIPEKSYEKLPKYLFMLKAANPGTHYNIQIDDHGRFKYMFLAFGQSIRGFDKTMRRVIVVDGTFLKNKYRGVLLVATALDGNNNVYPLAFGVVDSENDLSWDWFMRELNVVIPDSNGLAFVSDRNSSIGKAIQTVYPESRHGICIHHLMNNVVSTYHGKSLIDLVADASKYYRPVDFEAKMATICNINPKIGQYLIEADVRKWARCQFPGFRYDVRTNNPAESINSALRAPREYPLIPLIDSIREMLTRWFNKRRKKSSKHMQNLTIKVEEKVARRIRKGRTFTVYQINDHRFHVKGDKIDCLVDLNERTCTCGKYTLVKIPCRHAIKAGLSIGRDAHSLTDEKYTTLTWRAAYEESVNPISVPEDAWRVPPNIEGVQVLPPISRRQAGRQRKQRFESVEDKIRKSGELKRLRTHKCSRCNREGHNRSTCKMPI